MYSPKATDIKVSTAVESRTWAARTEQEAHLLDVASEGELELSAGQVPDLDGPICRARGKPLVAGVHCYAAHPPAPHVAPH